MRTVSRRRHGGRRRHWSRRSLAAVAALPALALAACSSELPQSSLNPASDEAESIDRLWILVLTLATVIFVVVMVVFVIAMIRFRARKGDDTEPKQIHGNTRLEITWTIIPAVVLAVVAVPTVRTLFDLRAPAEGPDVVTVNVIGHQWWWEFQYPDFTTADGRPLTTANELHVPVGRTTSLVMTSADVLHSFWVPPLAGKRDLLPGELQQMKFTPNDRALALSLNDQGEQVGIPGQCAEYCWLGHADMRMRVFVETEADFENWVGEQLQPALIPADGTPAATGYETFTELCTVCHQAYVDDGAGAAAVGSALAPDLTHFGGRTTLGAAILDNTAEHLAQWIDNPPALKPMAPDLNDLQGRRLLGMPDYGLTADEIAGLVTLLESWK